MNIKSVFMLLLLFLVSNVTFAAKNELKWTQVLQPQYFPGKVIQDGSNMIRLKSPVRAEDPALVPVKVTANIKQTKERYIKRLLLLIDNNPVPFVGEFEFTPESGKADIAMRVRVNSYSYIRAIAEMNNGDLYMVKNYVKASGGCSAPVGAD